MRKANDRKRKAESSENFKAKRQHYMNEYRSREMGPASHEFKKHQDRQYRSKKRINDKGTKKHEQGQQK